MGNKLFLVCPFSSLEIYLGNEYGDNIYFLTAMGSVFDFRKQEYLGAIHCFIKSEDIDEILIVNDTSCRFLAAAINNEPGYGTRADLILRKLIVEEQLKVSAAETVFQKLKILGELNIIRQAYEICNHAILGEIIRVREIRVSGLLTTKSEKIKTLVAINPEATNDFFNHMNSIKTNNN